ncbi:hypothetical protein SteCoe_24276 [Stentor coeruleus]|uniref:Uncharacterized protein n=1 Tax=Stentor coeruleus TaxID=5963 RepID=A0A1R2BID6_9CILI|nr:hypothetical protein SteCoe_24276 [Stentor coeruleus]
MERYVFFNTDSASVLHYRVFAGSSDIIKLAGDSYSLLQTTNFSLKSIFKDKIFCFAKDPDLPLAVTLEFSKDSTTEEVGYSFAVHMLQLFIQQFRDILNGECKMSLFKPYRKTLQDLIDQRIEPFMEKITNHCKADFLYWSFIKRSDRGSESTMKKDHSGLFSSNSVNTDISGIDKAAKSTLSVKKKYPFAIQKDVSISSPRQQLFYRLHSKEGVVTPQLIGMINSAAALANDLLEFEKDELQSMEFCFSHSRIQVLKYQEMLLVISHNSSSPPISYIKQLYCWARVLSV